METTTLPAVSRRNFNRASLLSLVAAAAAASLDGAVAAEQPATGAAPKRRDVIKQDLPGEPARELILLEVTYPPGTGSPAHLHANGVMAFVISGAIVSKVNDGPEQTFNAGGAWWEPPGAVHRVSRNASATEPATLLAIYIAPKGAAPAELMKPM
jgi:quercetin dioxygenase-like cupin family protein